MDADVKRSGQRHNAPKRRLQTDEEETRRLPATLLKPGFDTFLLAQLSAICPRG